MNVTVSGRYNYDRVNDLDLLNPTPGPTSLTGDYTFQRFNPSVGITWSPVSTLNAYARFAQGGRAPTAIELGCANPSAPCSLPNSLSADPPLQQVVTDTWEVGLRGKPEIPRIPNFKWNVGAFRDENHNDILFVAAPELVRDIFRTSPKPCARVSMRIWTGASDRLPGAWIGRSSQPPTRASRPWTDRRTIPTILRSKVIPASGATITVHPGNRIPLIPKDTGKAYAIWQATHRLMFEMNEVIVSSSYARGNENNGYAADGVYYLGPGVSPGYAITNFRAHYDLSRHFQLALQVDNLFNHEYYTAAWLSNTVLTAQGAFQSLPFAAYADGPYAGNTPSQSATFFAPGAPRRAWVELGVKF